MRPSKLSRGDRLQIFGQLVSSNFAPTMEFCTDNGDVLIFSVHSFSFKFEFGEREEDQPQVVFDIACCGCDLRSGRVREEGDAVGG
jgi:hypothetical protein